MIPILHGANETNALSNGITRLRDVISCKVPEERNGAYELDAVVATTTPYFEEIKLGNIVTAMVSDGTTQMFRIDRVSKPINQRVTIHANHVSYDASFIPVAPFQADGITATLNGLTENALIESPFVLETDFTNETSTYTQNIPKSLRSCLGGSEGSLLDTFAGGGAGEYLWDNLTIKFLMHRGADRGVMLRYKKNITAFEQVEDTEKFITGVLPYWQSQDGAIVLNGDIQYASNHDDYPKERVVVLDLSNEFEQTPGVNQLNNAAARYLERTTNTTPAKNITLSFVDLSETGFQAIEEKIFLCDTVTVYYEPLDVTFKSKVVKTVWDVLKERYESIEIGAPKSSITDTITSATNQETSRLINTKIISVTQNLDYELGIFQQSITEVEEDYNDLLATVRAQGTSIEQNAQQIALKASQSTVDELTGKVTTLETNVSVTVDGLQIKQNTDGSYVLITDSGMEIYVSNQKKAYATDEGFYASTFVTGEWHIQPMNNGNTLAFFKREDD